MGMDEIVTELLGDVVNSHKWDGLTTGLETHSDQGTVGPSTVMESHGRYFFVFHVLQDEGLAFFHHVVAY
jgi:hypothetical protein